MGSQPNANVAVESSIHGCVCVTIGLCRVRTDASGHEIGTQGMQMLVHPQAPARQKGSVQRKRSAGRPGICLTQAKPVADLFVLAIGHTALDILCTIRFLGSSVSMRLTCPSVEVDKSGNLSVYRQTACEESGTPETGMQGAVTVQSHPYDRFVNSRCHRLTSSPWDRQPWPRAHSAHSCT